MKIHFFLALIFISLSPLSCGDGSESEEGGDDPKPFSPGSPVDSEDPDCDVLSSELPNDVITKFDLLATLPDTNFTKSASLLVEKNIPNFIQARPLAGSYKKRSESSKILEYEFYFNNTPLCYEHAKVYTLSNKLVLTGDLPPKETKSPFYQGSLPFYMSSLEDLGNKLDSFDFTYDGNKSLCYTVSENTLIPAWKVKVTKGNRPYEALLHGDRILELRPLFFNATISAKVYDESADSKSKKFVMKDYEIPGGSSGGTLCSNRFRIIADTGFEAPKKEDSVFEFDPSSAEEFFSHTALFVYAHLQSDYISSLDSVKSWYGPQVEIIPDMSNQGISNGATYLPGDTLSKPQILMPKGDGVKLENIRLDNEAVQHEVGHHVLYRSVQDPRGESLVIHEGVADAFVMLRTKDACLGEHLCLNDLLCVSKKCLRSADNDYGLNSADLPYQAHLQSQLISGLFWDLALELGHKQVANWLNYTIDFLPRRAYFSDLVIALYGSIDPLRKNGQLKKSNDQCSVLMEVYEKRDFMDIITSNNISCEG